MTDCIHPPTNITYSEYNETRFLFTSSQKYTIFPSSDASEVLHAGISWKLVFVCFREQNLMHKWGLCAFSIYSHPIQPQQLTPLDNNNPFEACETTVDKS
jgi:hypothetical protein